MKKNIALYGVLIALAFIFSYVETLIPVPVPMVPGIKLGLANVVVVVALYTMGTREAFVISIVRILLVGFTFGNLYSAVYGLCGGLLSFGAMALCKKTGWFGIMGTSLLGGLFHNVGQFLIALFVTRTGGLAYYLPVLLIVGAITGTAIGAVGGVLVNRLKKLHH